MRPNALAHAACLARIDELHEGAAQLRAPELRSTERSRRFELSLAQNARHLDGRVSRASLRHGSP